MASPPLKGLRVLEFAGLAPGPFAGMLLADAGATVLRIDRPTSNAASPTPDLLARRKASLPLNLKSPRAVSLLHALIPKVDILIDPFRPGVLERLDLGPQVLCGMNPRLIYARLTGFRRDGKYAHMAGHDINYLAVSGVLSMLGRKGEKPYSPVNLVADFAGGGAALVNGILLALLSRNTTGEGQVVEANMVDGSSYIATFPRYTLKTPLGGEPRGENILDGGCPWYDTYRTSDGGYMSVGALEPQFFAALLRGLGLQDRGWQESRFDRAVWPEIRAAFEEAFAARTRAEWEAVFDGTEACCVPVLEYCELETDPAREGDQRPMVELKGTPCLDPFVEKEGGAGEKGKRGGYSGDILETGHGGAELLEKWAGWTRGREFDLEDGGLVWKGSRPKL